LSGGFWTYIKPFIIPAIALGTLQTAILTRLLRSSMIDVAVTGLHAHRSRQGPDARHHHRGPCAQERHDPVRHHGPLSSSAT